MSESDKRRSTSLRRRSPSWKKARENPKPTMRSTMPTAFRTEPCRRSSRKRGQNRRNLGLRARTTSMPKKKRIGGNKEKEKRVRTGGSKMIRTRTAAKDPPTRSCSRRENEKNGSTPSCRGNKKGNRERPTDRREKRAEGLSGPITDGNLTTEPGPRAR